MDNSFISNAKPETASEKPVDKSQGLNAERGYPITEVIVGFTEKKRSLSSDTEIKEYLVDQVQQMGKEIKDYKEAVTKLTIELSKKNEIIQEESDITKALQENLPEHIYEVVSNIGNTTNSSYSDVISRALVLFEIALRTKANGGEIIIFDREGNPISNIEDLE